MSESTVDKYHVVPATPGFEVLEFQPTNGRDVLRHPVIAWAVKVSSAIGGSDNIPICPTGVSVVECGVKYPSGRVWVYKVGWFDGEEDWLDWACEAAKKEVAE